MGNTNDVDAEEAASRALEEKQRVERESGGKVPDGGQRQPW